MTGSRSRGVEFGGCLADRHDPGHPKGQFVRVDGVVLTVVDRCANVDDRVAGEDAAVESFLDALVDGREVLLRDRAALDRR
jgi:hypothetical protein